MQTTTEYEISSVAMKSFNLTLRGQELGRLKYNKWFSFQSEIILKNHSVYQIKLKHFWDTTYGLKSNEQVLLEFKMTLKGIVIKTKFGDQYKSFVVKNKGILQNLYFLSNEKNESILILKPNVKWSEMAFDYAITSSHVLEELDYKEVLVLTTVHCINYYLSMMKTVVAS